jgi:hypothetical protein
LTLRPDPILNWKQKGELQEATDDDEHEDRHHVEQRQVK